MRPLLKLTWVETKLFVRDPLAVIFVFAFPFFLLFVLAGVFGNDLQPGDPEFVRIWRGVGPSDYYIPCYVAVVVAALGLFSLPSRLAAYRELGVLRRFRAAGVPLTAVVGSQVVVMAGMAILAAVAMTLTSVLFYGTELPGAWPQTIGAFALSVLVFAAIGVLVGGALPSGRATQSAGLVLFFVMLFMSGAAPPRGVLTDAMREFSNVLPLTHVVLMMQGPWLGQGWDTVASLVTLGFLAGASALAIVLFRWE